MFPSLTGVIRFLINEIDYKILQTEFPSLTGVIRFLITTKTVENNDLQIIGKVSVPYRGYSFFN